MLAPHILIPYLETLVAEGTFTQAAKALYISQPYLSKVITSLEEELQTKIIERDRSPLELSYAGERLLAHLKTIDNQYETMINELTMITDSKYGRIRIGVHPILGSFLLPMILPDFHKKYPGIIIKVMEQDPKLTEEDILENKVDLYLGMMPLHNEDLSCKILSDDKWCIIVPKTSSLYKPEQKDIEEFPYPNEVLQNEKYVLTVPQSGIRRQTDEFLKSIEVKPNIILESRNIATVAMLARNGMGTTFLPQSALLPSESFEGYNIYHMPLSVIRTQYFIAYKKGKELSSIEKVLIELASENFKSYSAK